MASHPNDPSRQRGPVHPNDPPPRRGAGGAVAIVLVVLLAALAIAWALGLFNVNTSGRLEAPQVEVTGGQVPNVDVQTADVDVGTKTTTVEVPTVEVRRPGEPGNPKR